MTMTAAVDTDLDVLRSRFRAELADRLPGHIGRLGWTPDRLAAHQLKRLRTVFRRAVESSSFHRQRLEGIDVERFELPDLASLPTMTKADMMGNFDDLVTDGRLSRGRRRGASGRLGISSEPAPR